MCPWNYFAALLHQRRTSRGTYFPRYTPEASARRTSWSPAGTQKIRSKLIPNWVLVTTSTADWVLLRALWSSFFTNNPHIKPSFQRKSSSTISTNNSSASKPLQELQLILPLSFLWKVGNRHIIRCQHCENTKREFPSGANSADRDWMQHIPFAKVLKTPVYFRILSILSLILILPLTYHSRIKTQYRIHSRISASKLLNAFRCQHHQTSVRSYSTALLNQA